MSGSGGSSAIHGFLVQTLSAVLDGLRDERWTEMTLEPDMLGDKVDVWWLYGDRARALQVKSSRDSFGKAEVRKWAADLKKQTDEKLRERGFEGFSVKYELVLIGTVAQGVGELEKPDGVEIMPPLPNNLGTLTEQAAHRLLKFAEARKMTGITASTAEILVHALTTRLEIESTRSRPISRAEFERLIVGWIEAVPRPVRMGTPRIRPVVGDFVGREKEIGELKAALRAGGKAGICGLKGMGGVGKTELAVYAANQLEGEYPDWQVLLDMRGTLDAPRSTEDALASCIRAVTAAERLPETLDELRAMYLSALHGKRALLVIDNAKDGDQVRPLCPPDGCAMLVTSRYSFALPGMTRISIEELPPPEARKLLQTIAQRNLPDTLADRIAYLCGYLPLALRAAGSLLQVTEDLDPVDYAERLADERTRLKEIGKEGVDQGVEASLSLSFDRLSEDTRRVFPRLAVFPASFDAGAEEAVCLDENHACLTDLVRRSLVQFDGGTNRYRLHDLVRVFAETKLTEGEGFDARLRHARHYRDVLKKADDLYLQGHENVQTGLGLFDLERSNIVVGQAWAGRNMEGNEAVAGLCRDYSDAGVYVLNLRLHSREWIQWLETALIAARKLGDGGGEGNALGNLGNAHADLGETEPAIEYYEQQLEIARETNDRRGEGIALYNRALALEKLGRREEAKADVEAALKLYEAVESPNIEKPRRLLTRLWVG